MENFVFNLSDDETHEEIREELQRRLGALEDWGDEAWQNNVI